MEPVNPLITPYQVWQTRSPTNEELREHIDLTGKFLYKVKEQLIQSIAEHVDAAKYILTNIEDNGLEFHTNNYLDTSETFRQLLEKMPPRLPESIEKYKHDYHSCNLKDVARDVDEFGTQLTTGQYLFHGGFFQVRVGDKITLNRPLSTSFCSQVALRNAEWKGKAYDSGEVHLLVLKTKSQSTKAFIFPLNGDLGNEKEVLLGTGVELSITAKTLIRRDYEVCKTFRGVNRVTKNVNAYVIEADID